MTEHEVSIQLDKRDKVYKAADVEQNEEQGTELSQRTARWSEPPAKTEGKEEEKTHKCSCKRSVDLMPAIVKEHNVIQFTIREKCEVAPSNADLTYGPAKS